MLSVQCSVFNAMCIRINIFKFKTFNVAVGVRSSKHGASTRPFVVVNISTFEYCLLFLLFALWVELVALLQRRHSNEINFRPFSLLPPPSSFYSSITSDTRTLFSQFTLLTGPFILLPQLLLYDILCSISLTILRHS